MTKNTAPGEVEEGWGEGHRKEGGGWGRRTLVKGNVIKVSVCVKTKLIDIRGGKGELIC